MMHVAIHDALKAIDRRFRPYVYKAHPIPGASRKAAVAAAARDVLVSVIDEFPFPPECVQAGKASVEADYMAAIEALPNNVARMQGIRVGQRSAAAIIALRTADGSDEPLLDFDYPQGTEPGQFRFVPGFDFAAGAAWADVTPFVLTQGSQFRPGPPYKVSSRIRSRLQRGKVIRRGRRDDTKFAHPDQTQFGLFWIESSPLTWNRIARNVSADRGAGFMGERKAIRPTQPRSR